MPAARQMSSGRVVCRFALTFVGRLPPAGAGSGDPAYNDGSWKPHGSRSVAVVLGGRLVSGNIVGQLVAVVFLPGEMPRQHFADLADRADNSLGV